MILLMVAYILVDFSVELLNDILMISKGYNRDEAVHPAMIDLTILNPNELGIYFCRNSRVLQLMLSFGKKRAIPIPLPFHRDRIPQFLVMEVRQCLIDRQFQEILPRVTSQLVVCSLIFKSSIGLLRVKMDAMNKVFSSFLLSIINFIIRVKSNFTYLMISDEVSQTAMHNSLSKVKSIKNISFQREIKSLNSQLKMTDLQDKHIIPSQKQIIFLINIFFEFEDNQIVLDLRLKSDEQRNTLIIKYIYFIIQIKNKNQNPSKQLHFYKYLCVIFKLFQLIPFIPQQQFNLYLQKGAKVQLYLQNLSNYICQVIITSTYNLKGQNMIHQGSKDDPIYIKSEEEEEIELQRKLQYKRNKLLLDQAILTGNSFQIITALVMAKIPGSILDKQKVYQKELNEYYQSKIGINIASEFFVPFLKGSSSNENQQILKNQFILYGVDFMSSDMIRKRFSLGGVMVKQIRWINDSHCRLVLNDQEEGIKMLYYQMYDNTKLKTLLNDYTTGNQYRTIYKLKNYQVCKLIRPLFLRYAHKQDINLPKDTQKGQYYKFQQAYLQLQLYIINKYELQERYYQIIQKIHRSLFWKRRRNDEIRDRSREKMLSGYEQEERKFDEYIKERDSRAESKVIRTKQELKDDLDRLNQSFLMQFQLVAQNIQPQETSNHNQLNTSFECLKKPNNMLMIDEDENKKNTPAILQFIKQQIPLPSKLRTLSHQKSLNVSINPTSSISKLEHSKLSSLQITVIQNPAKAVKEKEKQERMIPEKLTTFNQFQEYLLKESTILVPPIQKSTNNNKPSLHTVTQPITMKTNLKSNIAINSKQLNVPNIPTIVIDDDDDEEKLQFKSMINNIEKTINPFQQSSKSNRDQKIVKPVQNLSRKDVNQVKKVVEEKHINLLDLDFVPQSSNYQEVLKQIQMRKKQKEQLLNEEKKRKEASVNQEKVNVKASVTSQREVRNIFNEKDNKSKQQPTSSRANNFISNNSSQSQIHEQTKASHPAVVINVQKDNKSTTVVTQSANNRQTAMKTTKNTNYNSTILDIPSKTNPKSHYDDDSY